MPRSDFSTCSLLVISALFQDVFLVFAGHDDRLVVVYDPVAIILQVLADS